MLGSGGYPMEWIQRPEQITVIYEAHNEVRRIYIDQPRPDPKDLVPSRDGSFTLKGEDYLKQFALPNFFFHITTAYALLRHNGVDLGKADYLGITKPR